MKIISNGDVHDTKVLDSEGNSLGMVKRITFVADAQEQMTRAVVEVVKPALEYDGPGTVQPLAATPEDDVNSVEINRQTLRRLAADLLQLADRDDLYNVHLHYSDERPLTPRYELGDLDPKGFVQSGPKVRHISIFDFAQMGQKIR